MIRSPEWEAFQAQGWAFRPGSDLSTLVAERHGDRVFGRDEEELLAHLSVVQRRMGASRHGSLAGFDQRAKDVL